MLTEVDPHKIKLIIFDVVLIYAKNWVVQGHMFIVFGQKEYSIEVFNTENNKI
jgi:hypothetical protein